MQYFGEKKTYRFKLVVDFLSLEWPFWVVTGLKKRPWRWVFYPPQMRVEMRTFHEGRWCCATPNLSSCCNLRREVGPTRRGPL